jgi:hypothetical protein
VQVGHHDVTAASHDPGELGDRRTYVLQVTERERAHRHVDLGVAEGQLAEVAVENRAPGTRALARSSISREPSTPTTS